MADDLTRKSVPLASPDFDSILESLTTFLKEQDELTDYDFEGSAMRVLLRTMAYNTHMNAFYLNMVGNESHLSTADRRYNVVLSAQDMGYVPRSSRSAEAIIQMVITPDGPLESVTIPQYTAFGATDGVNTFVFYTTESHEIVPNDFDEWVSDNITLTEGKLFTHKFTVTEEEVTNGWVIPNAGVDTRYVNIRVIETDISQTPVSYAQETDILDKNSESRVFWISEDEGTRHRISFGDDNIGRAIKVGYEVEVTYLVTQDIGANGVGTFDLSDAVTGIDTYQINVLQAAVGGAEIESISSIKFNAPKFYAAQYSALTPEDYKAIIINRYSNVADVKAWGGEDAEPPVYGRVFISIRPLTGTTLSSVEKDRIADEILSPLKVLGITTEIVDPDYLYISPKITVNYDSTKTSLSDAGIEAAVQVAVRKYFDETVSKFDQKLRYSVFLRRIDVAEESIINSNLDISLKKKFYPTAFGVDQNIFIDFGVPLKEGSLQSGRFTYLGQANCFFKQNSTITDQIDIYRINAGDQVSVVQEAVGQVDLNTGVVIIDNIQIASIPQIPQYTDQQTGLLFIPFEADPTSNDVEAKFNQIITIDDRDILVDAQREAS